jgi:predicted transcriptional regulator of viral defense system
MVRAAPKGEEGKCIVPADGIVRARDLVRQGFSRQRIMRLTQKGELVRVGRGLYSRPEADMTENHTLAQVCARVPHGVICMASALQFHNLTTQNPWQVWVMIENGARPPQMDYPPLNVIRAGQETFAAGVEEHCIEGVTVRVTCIAKTVADCFKYRNRIGLDVALEALKECLDDRRADRASIRHYARLCRVERIIRPYMEAFAVWRTKR